VAVTPLGSLAGSDSDVFGAFNEHGCVHEDLGDSGKTFSESVVEKEVDEVVADGILFLLVHGWCWSAGEDGDFETWDDNVKTR